MIQIRDIRRTRNGMAVLGLILSALSLIGLFTSRSEFFQSYLEGYLLWFGIAIGATAIWMLHNLVGGQWGDPIGRHTRAAANTLYAMPLFFVPILLGLSVLYPWARPGEMAKHETTLRQVWYLNTSFFLIRAVLLFLIWLGFVTALKKSSTPESGIAGSVARRRLQRWSSIGLLVFGLAGTVMSVDWLMSLDPRYSSTIFGLIVLMGELLGGFAFVIIAALLIPEKPSADQIIPEKLHDLGNLLLMSVMLWTYMAFSQYLLTWSGQLRDEVVYYNYRFIGGWQWFGGILLAFNFALPFSLLLLRPVKKRAEYLIWVAVLLLATRWFDLVWLVAPNFSPMHLHLSLWNFVIPAAIGGLWLSLFLHFLNRGIAPLPRGHEDKVREYEV